MRENKDDSRHPGELQGSRNASRRAAAVLIVAAVFAGVFAAKALVSPSAKDGPAGSSSETVTSARNDASADYEAARKSGKPVYVLFHSLS